MGPNEREQKATAAAGGASEWAAVASLLSGRHVLQVLVGSGVQRSVLTDWWMRCMHRSGHRRECEEEARQWLREGKGDCRRYWQGWVDACQRQPPPPVQ